MDNFKIQVFLALIIVGFDQHLTHCHWQASGGLPVLACTLMLSTLWPFNLSLPPPLPLSCFLTNSVKYLCRWVRLWKWWSWRGRNCFHELLLWCSQWGTKGHNAREKFRSRKWTIFQEGWGQFYATAFIAWIDSEMNVQTFGSVYVSIH